MQKRTKLTLSNAWSCEPISACKSAQWDGLASTAPRILRSVRFCMVHRRCCLNAHSTDRATGDPDIGEFADAVVLFKAGEISDDGLAR